MRWLRLGWLWAIGGALALAGGCALLMRFELLSPGPTLSPELYGHALVVHGFLAATVVLAGLLVVPTLRVLPGRGSVALGLLALVAWVAASGIVIGVELGRWLPATTVSRVGVRLLAASLGLGAAQLVTSIPANPGRVARGTLAGGLVAIAIVLVPLLDGRLPSKTHDLVALTCVGGAAIYDATSRGALRLALIGVVPGLALAWVALARIASVHEVYVADTVAMLAPLPAIGAALLGALLVTASGLREPHWRLASIAVGLLSAGGGLASITFFELGSSGMPRRYFAYPPEFQVAQIVLGVAAVVAAIGCVLALAAFRHPRGA
jgi:heme/copper-type cytochrome/quinol oxidase subunit 1